MAPWKREVMTYLHLIGLVLAFACICYALAYACVAVERLVPGFTPRSPF